MPARSIAGVAPARRGLLVGMLVALGCLAGAGPAAAGNFVIGDQNAAVGSNVTFWGAQWWKLNSLSGGGAPPSFKGYADSSTGLCGVPWTTAPGNSSEPPAAPLPELIEVVVSSSVAKSGPTISGDAPKVVLVRTDPGYQPDPGHAGTGTVVSIVCPRVTVNT
jgi:hypothetical protein